MDELARIAEIDARKAILKAELHALTEEREKLRDRTPKVRARKAKQMRSYSPEYNKRPEVKARIKEYRSTPEFKARERARWARRYAAKRKGKPVRKHPVWSDRNGGVDKAFDDEAFLNA